MHRAVAGSKRFASNLAKQSAGPSASLRDIVLAGDYESAMCGHYMPSSTRDAFFALRAFNIELSGARDAARGNLLATRVRLQFFRDLIAALYKNSGSHAHPLFQPLASAINRHNLTRRWFERLVDARAAALDAPPPNSIADLDAYADQTSSSLLLLSLEICGVRDDRADEAAVLVGRASGLSTVLRGLPVRLAREAAALRGHERAHNYAAEHHGLPAESMRRVGLTDAALLQLAWHELTTHGTANGKSSEDLCSQHAGLTGTEASKHDSIAENSTKAVAASLTVRRPPTNGSVRLVSSPAARKVTPQRQLPPDLTPLLNTSSVGGLGQQSPNPDVAETRHRLTLVTREVATGAYFSVGLFRRLVSSVALVLLRLLVVHMLPVGLSALLFALSGIAAAADYLNKARVLSPQLPLVAAAALLPAVPTSRFLSALKDHQNYDLYASGKMLALSLGV